MPPPSTACCRSSNALERGGGRGGGQRGGGRTEQRGAAGADHERGRGAGLRDRPAEQRVPRFRGGRRGDAAGAFVDRIGLAGQRRFVGGKRGAVEDQRIGGDDVAGADLDDVTGHTASIAIATNAPS